MEHEYIDYGDLNYCDLKVVNDTIGYGVFGQYLFRKPAQEYERVVSLVQDDSASQGVAAYYTGQVLHVVSRQKAIRSLELLDATGRCVLQHCVDNAHHVELPESSPAGFSLIRCVFSDGSHAVVKCIKH